MSNAEILRKIFQDVLETGKFERTEILAVLSSMMDIEDRLERVEAKCEMKPPD
jgi:hypothetical protein